MERAPCIPVKKGMIVICSSDDLIRFAEEASGSEGLKTELANKFQAKHLEKPVQFLGIKFAWPPADPWDYGRQDLLTSSDWLLEWAALSLLVALLLQASHMATMRSLLHFLPLNMNAIAESREVYFIRP